MNEFSKKDIIIPIGQGIKKKKKQKKKGNKTWHFYYLEIKVKYLRYSRFFLYFLIDKINILSIPRLRYRKLDSSFFPPLEKQQ